MTQGHRHKFTTRYVALDGQVDSASGMTCACGGVISQDEIEDIVNTVAVLYPRILEKLMSDSAYSNFTEQQIIMLALCEILANVDTNNASTELRRTLFSKGLKE